MENSIHQDKIIQNIEEIREIVKPSDMIEIQTVFNRYQNDMNNYFNFMNDKVKNLSTQHSSLFQTINNYMNNLEELRIFLNKGKLDMSVQTENSFETPNANNIITEDSLNNQSECFSSSSSKRKKLRSPKKPKMKRKEKRTEIKQRKENFQTTIQKKSAILEDFDKSSNFFNTYGYTSFQVFNILSSHYHECCQNKFDLNPPSYQIFKKEMNENRQSTFEYIKMNQRLPNFEYVLSDALIKFFEKHLISYDQFNFYRKLKEIKNLKLFEDENQEYIEKMKNEFREYIHENLRYIKKYNLVSLVGKNDVYIDAILEKYFSESISDSKF